MTDVIASEENRFTSPTIVRNSTFMVTVSGDLAGAVVVQMRPLGREIPQDWADVLRLTSADSWPQVRLSKQIVGEWELRAGVKTGDYTSGKVYVSVVVR